MPETSGDKFKVGDRVRVKEAQPAGNPRTPMYVRGKTGVIVATHGVITNPHDHRGLYPPLYTIMFEVKDLFGEPDGDKLCVDVHEEWLELTLT